MTKSLQNKDIKTIRELLYEEQKGFCKLTGEPIPMSDAVLDHNHSNQYVRGVLHRQANAALGKIENIFTRFLKWWYPGSLSDFLRKAADYIDSSDDHRFYHPGWKGRVVTNFRALNEKQKAKLMEQLHIPPASNGLGRAKNFIKALNKLDFDTIKEAMKGLE